MIPYSGIVRKGDDAITEKLERGHKKIEDSNSKVDSYVDNNGKLSDNVAAAAPGTTVAVYNQSRKHKKEATIGNWAARLGGGAAGGAAGFLVYRASKGRVKALKGGKKAYFKMGKGKRQGIAGTLSTGVGSTIGGYAASRGHQEYIKRNPRYQYEEK
jgi:hypothetical protein